MSGGGGSAGAGRMPDVPEVSPQSEAPFGNGNKEEEPSKRINIMTSSSVDSIYSSFGGMGSPTTPTSPGIMMSSPQAQRFQSFNTEEDEDDDARVEDVDAFPATVDDTKEVKSLGKAEQEVPSPTPKAADRPPPTSSSITPSLPASTSSSSLDVYSPSPSHSQPGHGRTPSGPRLRNPCPSNPTTSTTNEEGHANEHPSESPVTSSISTERIPSRDGSESSKHSNNSTAQNPSSSTSTSESTPSNDRKPSFARRSLLRAARASSEQGRESSPPALARSASEGANGHAKASTSTGGVDGEYAFGYDEDAGKGIDVAGTARDLLGAISKGIWGSLGRGSK